MNAETPIRVKISSEDAGAISLSRVIVRDMALSELLGLIVSVTGKDEERIAAILERGSFVKGLSRLRWEGSGPSFDLAATLATMPGDWPERPFEPSCIVELNLELGLRSFTLRSDVLRAKRLFRRSNFLDRLLEDPRLPKPAYQRFDYDENADRFRVEASPALAGAMRDAIPFLRGRALRQAMAAQSAASLVFLLRRNA